MKQFGEYIGIAFQIKDDLFDYQAKGLIGKPTGNDIKEKKLTLPLIYALENSSFIERRHILRTINKDNTNSEKVKIIVDFVISKGGLEYTSQMMYEYRDKAINMLSSYPSSDVKTSLIDLVNYTIERDK
jgi:octaprenyl-diphosphate synthase